MKVDIYTVLKNEEELLPFYLEHYKTRFPGCVIHIYDNNSTDQSVSICKAAGCIIYPFPDFIPYVNEELLQEHKNTCWKNSKADWIIVCDTDELIQIDHRDLVKLDSIMRKAFLILIMDFRLNLMINAVYLGVISRI